MRLEVAAALLLSAVGAKARPSFVGMKNIPEDAFKNIPSLAAKDRKFRADLERKLKGSATSKTHRAMADEDGWKQYQEYWNSEMVVEEFGFDIDHYALKYTGCKVVKGWDDEVAQNQNFDTVLGTETFVTFRLCPEDQCDSDYSYGCTTNYGEYMLKLDEYVEALTAYREHKKESFCTYCELCAAMRGYADWNAMMQGSVQNLAAKIEDVFDDFYTDYMSQNQQDGSYYSYNNKNNNNLQKAKIAYNKAAKNAVQSAAANQGNVYQGDNMYGAYGNNYGNNANANQYADNNYGSGYQSFMDMQAVIGSTKQYWNYQSQTNQQDNSYKQSGDWLNINSQYPTFCGKPVLLGYYNNNGQFVENIGYFTDRGNYYSFEDGEPILWDESCMGEIPYSWDLVEGTDPEELEVCDPQYSTSCSTAFQECQFTLHYEDMEAKYQTLLQKAQNYEQSSSITYQLNQFEQSYAQQTMELKYTTALTCQQVEDYAAEEEEDDMEESVYANQQNYEELYNQREKYNEALEGCNGDEDCQFAVQQSMQMNNEYQMWIIQSAWEEYRRYKALNSMTYIGAYCAEDGFGIGLKIFLDENCNVENDILSVEEVLGEKLEMSYDLVSGECIPCNNDQFSLDVQQQAQDEDEDLDYDSVDGVLPFCSMLYQLSAKCNKHLTPAKVYNAEGFYMDGIYYSPSYSLMYGSEQQQDNEKKICSMVDSLNSGTYREDGSITLGITGWTSAEHWKNEFASASTGMPKGTKTLIFVMMICSAAMGLWAMVLQGALRRKNAPWHPKQGPNDFARQESGIVMGRSRSGPANTPLI